jgi:hypothetical protein
MTGGSTQQNRHASTPWPSNLAGAHRLQLFAIQQSRCSLAFKSCCHFYTHLHSLVNTLPIFLFILSIMNNHALRHLVTMALYYVCAPSVAPLCECDDDCPCVVQLDRKKKRVGACIGKRKVKGKKSSTRPSAIAPHTLIHHLPMISNLLLLQIANQETNHCTSTCWVCVNVDCSTTHGFRTQQRIH